jgi:hypothetical protein
VRVAQDGVVRRLSPKLLESFFRAHEGEAPNCVGTAQGGADIGDLRLARARRHENRCI